MYVAFAKSFLFCVMLAEKGEVASNYSAKMIMKMKNGKLPKRELTSVGPVISIENITSLKSPQTVYESWCVQYAICSQAFPSCHRYLKEQQS